MSKDRLADYRFDSYYLLGENRAPLMLDRKQRKLVRRIVFEASIVPEMKFDHWHTINVPGIGNIEAYCMSPEAIAANERQKIGAPRLNIVGIRAMTRSELIDALVTKFDVSLPEHVVEKQTDKWFRDLLLDLVENPTQPYVHTFAMFPDTHTYEIPNPFHTLAVEVSWEGTRNPDEWVPLMHDEYPLVSADKEKLTVYIESCEYAGLRMTVRPL